MTSNNADVGATLRLVSAGDTHTFAEPATFTGVGASLLDGGVSINDFKLSPPPLAGLCPRTHRPGRAAWCPQTLEL